MTEIEQKPEHSTLLGKFHIFLYYADALYQSRHYAQAETLYRQALQMRKTIVSKSKNLQKKVLENQEEVASDVDIKYKIHRCCLALNQKNAAADILQTIAARQRTPKIYMALGNIYKDVGMDRLAITCFKEVLRECPLAVEAMEILLKLGVNVSCQNYCSLVYGVVKFTLRTVSQLSKTVTSHLPRVSMFTVID